MDVNGSTDIRTALDRLQSAFDLLGDRYRELRRERKLLRDQLDAEQQKREEQEISVAAGLEHAAEVSRHAAALEARLHSAEEGAAGLHNRIVELEEELRKRDAAILHLEDTAAGDAARIEAERATADTFRTRCEILESELGEARGELHRRTHELEELRSSARVMEEELAARGADAQAGIEQSRTEIAAWSARYEREREERLALEEKQLQTIAKLDAATRAEAQARGETAQAVAEAEMLREERDGARNEEALLREMLRDVETLRAHAEAERERAERAEHSLEEHRTTLEAERRRLVVLEAKCAELEAGNESGGEPVAALRERMAQAENEIVAALELATRSEHERNEIEAEREELRRQVARMSEEIATLRVAQANGSANGLSPEQSAQLVQQIDTALRLIDEQLGES